MQWIQFIRAAAAGAYVPAGAIWLDGSADYLNWTPSGAPDDGTEWWLSVWIKDDGQFDGNGAKVILGAGTSGTNYYTLDIDSTNYRLRTDNYEGGQEILANSDSVHRDYSAWKHIIVHYDSDEGTAADRYTVYVNGEEVVMNGSPTYQSSAATSVVLSAVTHRIGLLAYNTVKYWSGYMADFAMVDGGGSLTIADFGETDALGNWAPKDLSGLTFGTNGFWLDFANSAALGTDASGNGNNFTVNSMSSANATNDNPADDATNGYGNYATFNDEYQIGSTAYNNATYSQGNTHAIYANGEGSVLSQAIPLGNGIYFEATLTTPFGSTFYDTVGFIDPTRYASTIANIQESPATGYSFFKSNGQKSDDGATLAGYGSAWDTAGKVIGVYISPTGKVWYTIDGTLQNSATESEVVNDTGTSHAFTLSGFGQILPVLSARGSNTVWDLNCGQFAWNTTPYSGYAGLSTANTPAPTVTNPSTAFNTVLYEGNGTAVGSGGNAITGVGFQPDFVWIKNRDAADEHMLYDAVRGVTKDLNSDSTSAEATDTEGLSTFDTDGFTVGSNVAVNTNAESYVAWCMKAGGSGSSNTDGSITSTVSVADHGGFSIITYTGTGSNATVGHGLSSAPDLILNKNRSGTARSWRVYSSGLTSPGTQYLNLDGTSAEQTDATIWNSTAPTTTVFSIGTDPGVNTSSQTNVVYAFARTPGLIGIGSYTGNGSADGPYVVVDDGGSGGFRPAWLLVKRTDSTGSWNIADSTRSPYNVSAAMLQADATAVEATAAWTYVDFLANGFKIRGTDTTTNASGSTYIYLAFAEYPFGGEGVAQARAR
jgi:hypothetical protein